MSASKANIGYRPTTIIQGHRDVAPKKNGSVYTFSLIEKIYIFPTGGSSFYVALSLKGVGVTPIIILSGFSYNQSGPQNIF